MDSTPVQHNLSGVFSGLHNYGLAMMYWFALRENFQYNMPTSFLAFTYISSICCFQLKFVGISMPKYLYSLSHSSKQPSSVYVGVVACRLRVSNMLLHLATLNTIELLQDQ